MSNTRAPLMTHEERVALINQPFGITHVHQPRIWAGCFIPDEAPAEPSMYPTRFSRPLFVTYIADDPTIVYDRPDYVFTEDEEDL